MPSGEMRWSQTDKLPYTDHDGAVLGVIVISQDITDRQHAEEARVRYTRQLETLHQTGLILGQLQDPIDIGESVIGSLSEMLKYQQGAFVVKNLDKGDLDLLAYDRTGLSDADYQKLLGQLQNKLRSKPGLISYAVEHGEVVCVGNVQDDPRYIEVSAEIRSELVVPVKISDQVLGAISVLSKESDAFGPEDERLLSTLASQAANALKNTQTTETLRQSKETAERYLNIAAEIIISLDIRGDISLLNESGHRLLGYQPGELIGENWFNTCVPAAVRAEITDVYRRLMGGEVEEFKRYENAVLTQNGDERIILWHNTLLEEDGRIVGLLSSGEDITERKFYEQEILRNREELRILTTRLAEAEENERRCIARELHDQVGQSLAVLGFSLNVIRERVAPTASESDLSSVDDSISMVDEISNTLRSVMDDLRPSVLDDYGLFSALSWYGDRYAEQTGIQTQVIGNKIDSRLAGNIENALFRIAQEALANVTRHAQAKHVAIALHDKGEFVEMLIRDDGSGFEETVPIEIGERRGWGLVNMRERAEMIGGNIVVETTIKQGTTIKVVVPKG